MYVFVLKGTASPGQEGCTEQEWRGEYWQSCLDLHVVNTRICEEQWRRVCRRLLGLQREQGKPAAHSGFWLLLLLNVLATVLIILKPAYKLKGLFFLVKDSFSSWRFAGVAIFSTQSMLHALLSHGTATSGSQTRVLRAHFWFPLIPRVNSVLCPSVR